MEKRIWFALFFEMYASYVQISYTGEYTESEMQCATHKTNCLKLGCRSRTLTEPATRNSEF